MRTCCLTLLGLIMFFFTAASQQEAGLSVEVSKSEISPGTPLEVIFTIENSRNGRFVPPDWQSAGWLVQGSSQSSSFTLSSGKSVSKATYRFQLVARDTGVYEVPPALLKDNGGEFKTSPVEIRVTGTPMDSEPQPSIRQLRPAQEANPKKKIKTIRL